MNMKFVKQTITILVVFVFVSCKQNNEKPNLNSQTENKILKSKIEETENFEEFNKKFHSDSLFQVSRVDFPIEGKHIHGFERYNWTKKNWEFLTITVSEKTEFGEYEHSLVKTDSLITERFWIPDSGFEVERQFKLINNKWFLIYFNDINL